MISSVQKRKIFEAGALPYLGKPETNMPRKQDVVMDPMPAGLHNQIGDLGNTGPDLATYNNDDISLLKVMVNNLNNFDIDSLSDECSYLLNGIIANLNFIINHIDLHQS